MFTRMAARAPLAHRAVGVHDLEIHDVELEDDIDSAVEVDLVALDEGPEHRLNVERERELCELRQAAQHLGWALVEVEVHELLLAIAHTSRPPAAPSYPC